MPSEDDSLDIDLGPPSAESDAPPPADRDGLPIGAPSGSPVVVIEESVRQWIETYARGDTTRERGGMLLGRLHQRGDEARVSIEAAVEAVGAEERRASITFTHETWAHINAVKEERYPHLRTVGWFHTHPGYGIFLSGYDQFIHRNFFDLPWQVAFVVDPVSGDSGFFGWRGEEVSRLPGYYALGAEATRVAQPAPAAQEAPAVVPARRPPLLLWAGAGLAVAAVVLLALHLPRSKAQPGTRAKPSQEARRPQVKEKLPGTMATPPKVPPAKGKQPVQHYVEVQAGDTLWDMSHQYLGDARRYPELQKLNGISDPRRIRQGTIVAVPAPSTAGREPPQKGEADNGQGQRDGHRRHREQGAAGDAAG